MITAGLTNFNYSVIHGKITFSSNDAFIFVLHGDDYKD